MLQMPSGGGNSVASIPSQKPDEFVKQGEEENKKKLSTSAKIGIGTGILAVAGIALSAIFTKGKTLKPANFAEHIDFKPAQTMEEAVEFAKKHLGIKNFNLGDDLEMANWVNEGLVGINNRFKGKAHMPKNVVFDEKYFAKNTDAGAYHCAATDTIAFNKEYFSNELISRVKRDLEVLFPQGSQEGTVQNIRIHGEDCNIKNKLLNQYAKLSLHPNEFTRFDAVYSFHLMEDYTAALNVVEKNPTYFLEIANKNVKLKSILENNGIDLSIDNFRKLSPEKQKEYMKNFFHISYENNIAYFGHSSHRGNGKFDTLYHEMGHLLHSKNVSTSEYMWGHLSKKSTKEFLSDNAKLETAGKISWYAQTDPEEFVAETFSALCSGPKLPDDVMELYRFYKGPEIPNM